MSGSNVESAGGVRAQDSKGCGRSVLDVGVILCWSCKVVSGTCRGERRWILPRPRGAVRKESEAEFEARLGKWRTRRHRLGGVEPVEDVRPARNQPSDGQIAVKECWRSAQADVRLERSTRGRKRYRQSAIHCEAGDGDTVRHLFVEARVHLVPPKSRLRVLAVSVHEDGVLQGVDRAVVGKLVLVARVEDVVVVVDGWIVERVVGEEAPHGLHVGDDPPVRTRAEVGAERSVPLAHWEPHDGVARRQVLLEPPLVRGRLRLRLVVVPLIER
mmetsp:Transcript_22822/g.48496  ORF Transcript_22822/g.48496 Transcript_22822/m.48496 type:complete len:272 (+) Transcript_22822:173-988(+)